MKAKATKKKASKGAAKKAAPKAKPTKAVKKKAKARESAAKPKAKRAASPKPAAEPPRKPAKPGAKGRRKATPRGNLASRRKRFAAQRESLLRKQAELVQAYSISKGDSQSHLDSGTEDYIDYAVNSYAREFLLSLSELDRKQLLLVEDALRRIDRGEYGDCQQCGEPIAPKRLEVAPWARHCVRCQELEEKGLLPQSSFALQGDDELEDRDEDEEDEDLEAEDEDGDAEEDEDVEEEEDEPASEPEDADAALDDDSELDDDDEVED